MLVKVPDKLSCFCTATHKKMALVRFCVNDGLEADVTATATVNVTKTRCTQEISGLSNVPLGCSFFEYIEVVHDSPRQAFKTVQGLSLSLSLKTMHARGKHT